MEKMKAVRIHSYGGPEVLVYEDVPIPEPGIGEVRISVHAAGVNPLDWKVREGSMKELHTLPLILGWDVAGIVDTAGRGVADMKPGDAIYGLLNLARNGAYAQYAIAEAKDMAFKPKTDDFVHAAAVPVSCLAAWQSLFDLAHLMAGQTVFIQGATGGVGHYAVQLAKWRGARVIGTTSGDSVDFAKKLGVDEVIDYRKTRFEDEVGNVDVVLDLIGGETQRRSWQVVKKGGVLVSTVGITSPEEAVRHEVRAEALRVHPDARKLTEIATLIDGGKLKPIVADVLPLNEARKAQEMVRNGKVKGKVVLKVRD